MLNQVGGTAVFCVHSAQCTDYGLNRLTFTHQSSVGWRRSYTLVVAGMGMGMGMVCVCVCVTYVLWQVGCSSRWCGRARARAGILLCMDRKRKWSSKYLGMAGAATGPGLSSSF